MTTTNTDTATEQTTAERAKDELGRVTDAAKEEVSQVAEQARVQGRALLSDASDRLHGEAEQQSKRAAEGLRAISTDFRTMAESAQSSGSAGTWVRMGADQIEGLAERLETGGFDGLAKEIGGFAKRHPATFLAVTFGAGVIAGRVVKNMDIDRMNNPESGGSQNRSQAQISNEPELGLKAGASSGAIGSSHHDDFR